MDFCSLIVNAMILPDKTSLCTILKIDTQSSLVNGQALYRIGW